MTNLSVPSVIFADATWYGSLRGGVNMGGGADDPSFSSFASRWGIKGSSEVSEGLTAVYKFETRIGANATSTNAMGGIDDSQSTNQLYVGLSGGFGSITLGKQSGAAYNHSGAIRDISNWHSHGDVGSRISNALSYSYAAESFSMQVAAIMDGATDTDGAVDRAEFGMTVGLGDIGKVAIGYEKQEDSMMAGMAMKGAVSSDLTDEGKVSFTPENGVKGLADTVWRMPSTAAKPTDRAIVKGTVSDVKYMAGMGATAKEVMVVEVTTIKNTGVTSGVIKKVGDNYYTDACDLATDRSSTGGCATSETVYALISTAYPNAPKKGEAAKAVYMAEDGSTDFSATATVTPTVTAYGHKASHISASFGLAGITVGLGHTTKDSNDPMMSEKEKTNFLGASGGIGDSGLSWNAWGRNVDGHDGMETSPWTVGLAKSLGGGASTFIEHTNADNGKDGTTSIALRVDF